MSAKICGPNSDQMPHTPNAAARFVHSRFTMPLSYSASSGAVGSNRYGASWWNVARRCSRIAIEQHRAQRRHEHHLVGVADDAVGLLDAGEQVAMPRAERQRAAVGRIDVQPDIVPAANVGDVGRADRTRRSASRTRRPKRRRSARRATADRSAFRRVDSDPSGGGRRARPRRFDRCPGPGCRPIASPNSARRRARPAPAPGCDRRGRRSRRRRASHFAPSAGR